MRQASWEDMFRAAEPTPPKPPPWWTKLAVFSWEDIVTLVIVMIGFLATVQSINSANWVNDMPSLYPIAFLGLVLGLAMSRLKVNELFIHMTALAVGVVGVFYTVTSNLDGSVTDRASEVYERVHDWLDAAFSGGISNDHLPFVLMVVAVTYLTAYLAAWAIFKWYNAWLAIIPGGLALLTNISYLPGQKSFALLVFLFCAILLVARMNLLRRARAWRLDRTHYPDMISLHVLNVTVWVALGLLAIAWVLPVSGGGPFQSVWDTAVSPITGPLDSLNRVFLSVNSKKSGSIHSFGSNLPLLGAINLGGGEIMKVTAQETGFLRAQSYDVYTAQGWQIGKQSQATAGPWPALKALQSPDEARKSLRRPVSVQVTTTKKASVLVSDGEPLAVSIDSRVIYGADPADVASLRPLAQLPENSQYRVDSTVSNASVAKLQQAPTVYPQWANAYLQLPADLPKRVIAKAKELTQGSDTPYDKANAIEQYLRTFTVDTTIPAPPPKRDSVDYFLFTLQRGYFDYHASAMVVLLRSLGVPARLAVGYTIRAQDRVPDTNIYDISEANAFAWPEVYFPTLGWVEFNPTPSEPKVSRTGTDDTTFNDTGTEEPFDDSTLAPDTAPPTDSAPVAVDNLTVEKSNHVVSKVIVTVILGLMALTGLVVLSFNWTLQRGLGNSPYAVQVWEKTLRLARWSKIRPLPQETPREVMLRLRRQLPDVEDLDYMTESYVRARYGQKELQPAEKERLNKVWGQARKTLLARFLRWK
jgi:transglutaminase-like putative cysteine protease